MGRRTGGETGGTFMPLRQCYLATLVRDRKVVFSVKCRVLWLYLMGSGFGIQEPVAAYCCSRPMTRDRDIAGCTCIQGTSARLKCREQSGAAVHTELIINVPLMRNNRARSHTHSLSDIQT